MSIVENIRKELNEQLPIWDQPSMAIGIVKDGEIVLSEAVGYRDIDQKLPANDETVYQIGSCSKAFTAAAAAILVDRGLLDWDTPVVKYMPWLRFKEEYTTMNATTRDLLCHRTGLPRHDDYWIDGPCTRKEMVENLATMQPCWPFRTTWCYQNTCYVAVGMLIETLTGQTWEEFVQKEIFEPLGMTRSSFYVDYTEGEANHATPYDRPIPTDTHGTRQIPFLKSDREDMAAGVGAPYGPAGSIMSTIGDMLKWVQFNLNKGKVGDKQIISEANMNELHKPNMLMDEPLVMPAPEMDFFAYGMGWFTETFRGRTMVEHGGNINGFTALVTMVPEMNLGIVNLVNFNNSFNTYATAYSVIDKYLGIEDGNWHERWREFVGMILGGNDAGIQMLNGEKVEGTKPSRELKEYAGTYRNATYGDIVITFEDDKLYFEYNKCKSPCEHFHYDTFQIKDVFALFNGMNYTFKTDKFGKVSELSFGIVLNPVAKDEIFVKVEG